MVLRAIVTRPQKAVCGDTSFDMVFEQFASPTGRYEEAEKERLRITRRQVLG